MRIFGILILNADDNTTFRNLVGIGLVRIYRYSFSVLHKIIDFFSHFFSAVSLSRRINITHNQP